MTGNVFAIVITLIFCVGGIFYGLVEIAHQIEVSSRRSREVLQDGLEKIANKIGVLSSERLVAAQERTAEATEKTAEAVHETAKILAEYAAKP